MQPAHRGACLDAVAAIAERYLYIFKVDYISLLTKDVSIVAFLLLLRYKAIQLSKTDTEQRLSKF